MLNISEIFYSIQGESSYAGLPCIFIRLAGCNLKCCWCDTTYHNHGTFQLGIEEICTRLTQDYDCRLVEITGGEPLLQAGVYPLMQGLIDTGYQVLVETNGSIPLANVPPQVIKIVDVKCPGSGEVDSFLAINLSFLNEQDELKFVLKDRTDYEWARDFIKNQLATPPGILFSIVSDSLQNAELAKWILADNLKVRMQLQLHKYIWPPDMRGV